MPVGRAAGSGTGGHEKLFNTGPKPWNEYLRATVPALLRNIHSHSQKDLIADQIKSANWTHTTKGLGYGVPQGIHLETVRRCKDCNQPVQKRIGGTAWHCMMCKKQFEDDRQPDRISTTVIPTQSGTFVFHPEDAWVILANGESDKERT